MKKILSSLTLLFAATSIQSQAAPEAVPEIVSMHTDTMKKATLELISPFPEEVILKGKQENWMKIIHQGEVVVALYESTPALIDIKEPFPYDEHVLVLEGEVTLTHIDGTAQTFKEGDSFLVPKGFLGTWDMPVHYREMIVVETKAWNEAEG